MITAVMHPPQMGGQLGIFVALRPSEVAFVNPHSMAYCTRYTKVGRWIQFVTYANRSVAATLQYIDLLNHQLYRRLINKKYTLTLIGAFLLLLGKIVILPCTYFRPQSNTLRA